MSFEINFDNLPTGYALSAGKGGEKVNVSVCEFVSSEDGDIFISRLEGVPNEIVSKLPTTSGLKPSVIDHMIVILRKDKSATVYINEVKFIGNIQVKRSVEKGESIFVDDIVDIHSLAPQDINIPNDAGLLILVSVGWRKGLFYDFWPIQEKDSRMIDYDIPALLGQIHSYLLFQNRFKISSDEWKRIIDQSWFPFIALKSATINDIINYNKNNWNIDELLSKIKDEFDSQIDRLYLKWKNNKLFNPHLQFIETAIRHYNSGDYLSSISVLYPRIEGLMRDYHQKKGYETKATQGNLIDAIITKEQFDQKQCSLLLPEKFHSFLKDVYFANFDPNGNKPLSRHSVSHGVANVELFTFKGAIIGFLILEQISYYVVKKRTI